MSTIPKVQGRQYVVKVNNEAIFVSNKLKEARDYIRNMTISDNIKEVELTKETVTEVVLSKLKPEVQKILTIDDFNLEE